MEQEKRNTPIEDETLMLSNGIFPYLPILAKNELEGIDEAFHAEKGEDLVPYRDIYDRLPHETQVKIGYLFAAGMHINANFYPGIENAFIDAMMSAGKGIEHQKLIVPFEWIGWAGKYNDVGPAYSIFAESFSGRNATLYYTDEDLSYWSEDDVKLLAANIEKESSGLSDFRVVDLPGQFDEDAIPGEETTEESRGILFRMDAMAIQPSVTMNGREYTKEETGGFVFVLPKTGEFISILGETYRGRPDCRIVLRSDSYCMK